MVSQSAGISIVWWCRWSVQEGGDYRQSKLFATDKRWRRTSWYAGLQSS